MPRMSGLYMGNSDGYQPIMNFTFEHNLVERTGNYNMEVKASCRGSAWPKARRRAWNSPPGVT